MTLLLLIGLLLVGVAVWLVVRAASLNRLRTAERIQQISAYGFAETGIVATSVGQPEPIIARPQRPLGETLTGIATAIGERLVTRVPGRSEEQLRTLLIEAG